ncbi:MAG: hypothetical protein BWZ02_01517 [Lentisphaerae bacterium ADurb.BinA184]|nr:MAG: hypothetical protein BWZ02_01517 [Lentisphaerae bacterium ADurb.BinA184]
MSSASVTNALRGVQAAIAAAARAAGRDPASVRLLAVSKTVPADVVRTAYAAGQRRFGENRVQELAAKAPLLPPDCEWHLIGHLQANKVRAAVQTAAWIHSVDSTGLIERLEWLADEEAQLPVILLQVNVSGEASKSGVTPAALPELARVAAGCHALDLRGLMTMAPYGAGEPELRAIFGGLRRLRDGLEQRLGRALPELSMGMSGDFTIAIAEGATVVRVGTAIFGERP